MTKTANPADDKPTPPPSDAQIVKEFIAEAATLNERAATVENEDTARVCRHHADARQVLADRLQAGKIARAEYIRETGERIVEAASNAGKAVAEFLNKVHTAADERANQDRQ